MTYINLNLCRSFEHLQIIKQQREREREREKRRKWRSERERESVCLLQFKMKSNPNLKLWTSDLKYLGNNRYWKWITYL